MENIHSYIYISNDLSIPSNDIQSKKQQLINFNQTTNEYLFNILHEQIQQLQQSFDNIKQNNQLSLNQSNDASELQDQVTLSSFTKLLYKFFRLDN